MGHQRIIGRTLMIFAVAAHATGCSTLNSPSSEWWQASVVDVMSQLEVPSNVDRHCSAPSSESGDGTARTVALVRYRIGRNPYSAAYAVAGGGPIHSGDRVLVQPSSCLIKLAPKSGDA